MIDDILFDIGLGSRRREDGWVIPPSARVPCEVALTQTGDQLRVEAVLADWDTIGGAEEDALTMFLRRATRELGYATCEIRDRGALLVARLPVADAEARLGAVIDGVLAASRRLIREASALLRPELAREYVTFHVGGSEILAGAGRN